MEINDILASNITGRLQDMKRTPNWLQQRVQPTSSAIFDFLNKKRASRSMKVDMLARVAEALEMPIGALLVPPSRREMAIEILSILHSADPVQADAVGGLVGDLVELSAREQSEAREQSDTPSKS